MNPTNDDTKFDAWFAKANNVCVAKCGMDLLDLPDIDYRGLFDSGVSHGSAADQAIREAGGM